MAPTTKSKAQKEKALLSSPKKKKNATLPVRIKQERGPFARVYSFGEEFTFELYIIENDSENDGYVKGLVDYIEKTEDKPDSNHPLFDECNFYARAHRRIPQSDNQYLRGIKKDFWRSAFLRYPKQGESTPETRQQGLIAISSFVKDPRYSKFPVKDITTVDMTDNEHLPSLDTFLLDEDIKKVVEQDIDEDELNENFVTNYPAFAKRIYSGNNYSDWARTLGFGNEPN